MIWVLVSACCDTAQAEAEMMNEWKYAARAEQICEM